MSGDNLIQIWGLVSPKIDIPVKIIIAAGASRAARKSQLSIVKMHA